MRMRDSTKTYLSHGLVRPVGSGEAGRASTPPPNNLLEFVDFVSEKGCKS